MSGFALEPIYGSLSLVVVLAVITIAITLWVTPPTADRNRRRWLVGLRLVAAAVLMLAILRPALIRTDNRAADAAIVVALDTSKSMTLSDGAGNVRFDTQKSAVATLLVGLKNLDDSLDVQVIAYAGDTVQVSLSTDSGIDAIENLEPNGKSTDLANAMLATIAAAGGQPIAGVVMVGDGTQTASVSGGGASQVARTLDSLGVPLWTVPIGPAAGDGDDRDVAIATLPDSFQWFAGNQVEIDFQVLTRGLAGIDIPVRLSWIDDKGKSKEFAVRQANSRRANRQGSGDSVAMKIVVAAPDPGTYRLVVAADTQDGETITTNNQQVAFVDVREGGGRVLYIEGALRQEYTFIRRALRRFPDLDLVARWIPKDTKKSWPVDLSGLFELGKFDVYIVGDVEAAALGREQLEQLVEAVNRGAGLVMIGGDNTFGRGGYSASALSVVLPVELNTDSGSNQITEPFGLSLARSHPITDLGGDQPKQVWRDLPPQLGANRFVGPKVAPGVEVLLQSEDEHPMLVVGSYGRGRVAALAFDSTYRWWRSGNSEVHRRFWRQLMLWLLSRDETSEKKFFIELDARRFAGDDTPGFRASLDWGSGSAGSMPLMAEVIDQQGNVQLIDTTELQSGDSGVSIRGKVPVLEPGIYRLQVQAGDASGRSADQTVEPAEIAFQVIDQSLELLRPMANPVFLQQLASQTADQGGRSFRSDEMEGLLEMIAQRRKKAETPIVEKNRLGDGPRTGWPLFLLFAGALSTEWFLRRRWNLA